MSRAREVSKIVLTVDSIEDNIDLSATITTASSAAVSAISDGAPENLNTLNELSSAINNDDNFYSTVENTYLDKGSASTTYTAKIDHQPSFRNLIINGSMEVWQRGTSTTGITASGYYTADRWTLANLTLGTWTQSVENDAPTGSGFAKSLKMLCTTADATPAVGDALNLGQRIEGQNVQAILKGTSSAKQITLSFWVKSNVTGTYIAELNDIDNTRAVSAAYTIASSGTWEKKTIVFPADTTGAFDNDNGDSLRLQFWLGAGTNFTSGTLATTWASTVTANRAVGQTNLAAATNNYWQITGVQLEVGAVATPFEFKPFAQDLIECQRYYCSFNSLVSGYPTFAHGMAIGSTSAVVYVQFPVEMRISPALAYSATGDIGVGNSVGTFIAASVAPVLYAPTNKRTQVSITVASGLTAGNGTQGYLLEGSTSKFIAFSSEL